MVLILPYFPRELGKRVLSNTDHFEVRVVELGRGVKERGEGEERETWPDVSLQKDSSGKWQYTSVRQEGRYRQGDPDWVTLLLRLPWSHTA